MWTCYIWSANVQLWSVTHLWPMCNRIANRHTTIVTIVELRHRHQQHNMALSRLSVWLCDSSRDSVILLICDTDRGSSDGLIHAAEHSDQTSTSTQCCNEVQEEEKPKDSVLLQQKSSFRRWRYNCFMLCFSLIIKSPRQSQTQFYGFRHKL